MLMGMSLIARSFTSELTSVFEVSTTGVDSSVTVTVSATEPTLMRIGRFTRCPSVTVTLVKVTVVNPLNSAFTV